MREKRCERIPPNIPVGAKLLECCKGFLGVLVSGPCVTSENFLGLSLYVRGKIRNECFNAFYHTPFPTLVIASRPNAR